MNSHSKIDRMLWLACFTLCLGEFLFLDFFECLVYYLNDRQTEGARFATARFSRQQHIATT